MKQLKNTRFDETIYKTVLDNGLSIIMVHKPEFRNSVALLGTKFGASHLKQIVNGETLTYHSGLAHFLEHKLFEKQDVDILSAFTNMGANANAFTSYNETVYYFSTTNDIQEPLNTLLDFVMNIELSEKGVEKEKGIIIEELNMYQEMPVFKLSMELLESLFVNHALKHDIAGTKESVLAITKDELEAAYETNYHPSQLLLSIVSPVEPEVLLEMIKANQSLKETKVLQQVQTPVCQEPVEVAKSFQEVDMAVNASKIALGFKQTIPFFNELEAYRFNVMTQMLMDLNFSKLNPDYQSWVDQKIISDLFVTQCDFGLDYGYLYYICETEEIEAFKALIISLMNNLKVDANKLLQIKKRYFGASIAELSDFESFAIGNFRAHWLNSDAFEVIELIENVSLNDLEEAIEKLDTQQMVEVVIRK